MLLQYKLSVAILDDARKVPEWYQHLKIAFEEILVAMSNELKQVMAHSKISIEGELFCTTSTLISTMISTTNLSAIRGTWMRTL